MSVANFEYDVCFLYDDKFKDKIEQLTAAINAQIDKSREEYKTHFQLKAVSITISDLVDVGEFFPVEIEQSRTFIIGLSECLLENKKVHSLISHYTENPLAIAHQRVMFIALTKLAEFEVSLFTNRVFKIDYPKEEKAFIIKIIALKNEQLKVAQFNRKNLIIERKAIAPSKKRGLIKELRTRHQVDKTPSLLYENELPLPDLKNFTYNNFEKQKSLSVIASTVQRYLVNRNNGCYINEYDLLKPQKRFLLYGIAGYGKTVLLKRLFMTSIVNKQFTPILINLSHWKSLEGDQKQPLNIWLKKIELQVKLHKKLCHLLIDELECLNVKYIAPLKHWIDELNCYGSVIVSTSNIAYFKYFKEDTNYLISELLPIEADALYSLKQKIAAYLLNKQSSLVSEANVVWSLWCSISNGNPGKLGMLYLLAQKTEIFKFHNIYTLFINWFVRAEKVCMTGFCKDESFKGLLKMLLKWSKNRDSNDEWDEQYNTEQLRELCEFIRRETFDESSEHIEDSNLVKYNDSSALFLNHICRAGIMFKSRTGNLITKCRNVGLVNGQFWEETSVVSAAILRSQVPTDELDWPAKEVTQRLIKQTCVTSPNTLSALNNRRLMVLGLYNYGKSDITSDDNWIRLPFDKSVEVSKHLICNQIFAKFIEDKGYQKDEYWEVFRQREGVKTLPFTAPLCWYDCYWNTPNQPVIGVSYYEAIAFCEWLAEKFEGKFRIKLPQVNLWQIAQLTKNRVGRDYTEILKKRDRNINWRLERTCPVNFFPQQYEIHDLIGNVWEWTDVNGDNHVNSVNTKGACWASDDRDELEAEAFVQTMMSRNIFTGFRVCRIRGGR